MEGVVAVNKENEKLGEEWWEGIRKNGSNVLYSYFTRILAPKESERWCWVNESMSEGCSQKEGWSCFYCNVETSKIGVEFHSPFHCCAEPFNIINVSFLSVRKFFSIADFSYFFNQFCSFISSLQANFKSLLRRHFEMCGAISRGCFLPLKNVSFLHLSLLHHYLCFPPFAHDVLHFKKLFHTQFLYNSHFPCSNNQFFIRFSLPSFSILQTSKKPFERLTQVIHAAEVTKEVTVNEVERGMGKSVRRGTRYILVLNS